MEFIDTHAHLFLSDFQTDRSTVVQNAISAGVTRMLLPNIDSSTVDQMMAFCNEYPEHCFPMIGLHPTSVKDDYKKHLEVIKSWLASQRFIAIGEIGMDLYWDKTFFAEQCEALIFQLKLAHDFSIPAVIHCRESFPEILDVLKKNRTSEDYKGVFHSFSGNYEQAMEILSMGFKIGISGVVTFKNSALGQVVKNIPLDDIMLETDSPYLTPVPFRGKRNESAYVVCVAQKIADIKQVSLEEVALSTTRNAKTLFNLP
jgi:TatD DNase family protein